MPVNPILDHTPFHRIQKLNMVQTIIFLLWIQTTANFMKFTMLKKSMGNGMQVRVRSGIYIPTSYALRVGHLPTQRVYPSCRGLYGMRRSQLEKSTMHYDLL